MVWSTLQTCMYVGVFMGLLIGADTLSGARERSALETLLLTPASRTQIVLGKFLASMSPWPVAMAVTFPCLLVVAQGDPIPGSVAQVGRFRRQPAGHRVHRARHARQFLVQRQPHQPLHQCHHLSVLPAAGLLPGPAQKGLVGKFFQRSNPLAAADEFLEKVIVNNRSLHDYGSWLKGPEWFPIIVIVLLFVYAGPRLRLEAGGESVPAAEEPGGACMSDRAVAMESGSPTWWIVFQREAKDLWVGGKALYLILIYMILLGIYSYTLAGNAEVKLLPMREMISEMVKHSIALGLFICIIVAADTFSGERERGTLETVLLTSARRRQVVLGKFLAAFSAWPAALLVAIPYWVVLAKGDPVLAQGLRWGIPIGTVLALAITSIGILVSMWCDSNKTSMLVSLCLFLLILLPSELSRPGIVQSAAEARKTFLYSLVNPWDAGSNFLVKTLAQQVPLAQVWYLPLLCAAFAIVTLTLLFGYAGPRLRLEAGTARKFQRYWERWQHMFGTPARRPARAREPSSAAGESLPVLSSIKPAPRPIERRPLPETPAASTWWVVFKKELGDLWVGGKALHLTVAYTVVLGIYTYVTARDSTLSLIPPKEMVFELTKAAMIASVFVSLIIGADRFIQFLQVLDRKAARGLQCLRPQFRGIYSCGKQSFAFQACAGFGMSLATKFHNESGSGLNSD